MENIFFKQGVVARTGPGGFSRLSRYPSINNQGLIAFVGDKVRSDDHTYNNVFTAQAQGDGSFLLRPLFNEGLLPKAPDQSPEESVPPVWQKFDDRLQINDKNLVLVKRTLRAEVALAIEAVPQPPFLAGTFDYLEAYNATAANQTHVNQVAFGKGVNSYNALTALQILNPAWAGYNTWGVTEPDHINIASAYTINTEVLRMDGPFSWNNNGDVVFTGLRSVNGQSPHYFYTIYQNTRVSSPIDTLEGINPRMADNGTFICPGPVATPNGVATQLYLVQKAFSGLPKVASPEQSFVRVGRFPGMSDDGHVVAFIGTRKVEGKAQTGLFLATDLYRSLFTQPLIASGTSGNGILEPGESFADLRKNSQFDPDRGEKDVGPFLSFDIDLPLSVQRLKTHTENVRYRVLFGGSVASGNGSARGIHAIDVDLNKIRLPSGEGQNPLDEAIVGYGSLVKNGDPSDETRSAFFTSYSLGDGLAQSGEAAIWVAASDGAQAILKCAREREALEVVDGNGLLARWYNVLHLSKENAASGKGRAVAGVSADGVSRIIIRTPEEWKDASLVEVSVVDEENGNAVNDVGSLEAGEVGELGAVYFESRETSVICGRKHRYDPLHGSFNVVYTAPRDFVRSGSKYEKSDISKGALGAPRMITIKAVAYQNATEIGHTSKSLGIYRPPVVLLHGLHDCSWSWVWGILRDPRFFTRAIDYSIGNGDRFTLNIPRIRQAIADVVQEYRLTYNIAATQVDAFGHSMGGVLLRMFACDHLPEAQGSYNHFHAFDTQYTAQGTFGYGYLHKLVLVNSPQFGSQLASFMRRWLMSNFLEVKSSDWFRQALSKIWYDAPACANSCEGAPNDYFQNADATEDLDPESATLRSILSVPIDVPTHAIVGIWTEDYPDSGCGYAQEKIATLNKVKWFTVRPSITLDDLYLDANDAAVPLQSQEAGLPIFATTRVWGPEGLHYPAINEYPEGVAARKAVELLNTRVENRAFAKLRSYGGAEFPLIRNPGFFNENLIGGGLLNGVLDTWDGAWDRVRRVGDWLAEQAEFNEAALDVQNPVDGGPGEQPGFWVRFQTGIPTPDAEGIFMDSLGNRVNFKPGTWVRLPLQDSFQGEYFLGGALRWGENECVRISPRRILFQTTRPLAALKWYKGDLTIRSYEQGIRPALQGQCDDGVWRDVDSRTSKILYSSSNTNVAEMGPDGVIYPRDGGVTAIRAGIGNCSASFDLTVVMDHDPEAKLTYAQWAASLREEYRAPQAEPFHDGLPNFMRYAFGVEQSWNADRPGLPKMRVEYSGAKPVAVLEYALAQYVDPKRVRFCVSEDLRHWEPSPWGFLPDGFAGETDKGISRLRIPIGTRSTFVRLDIDSQGD